MHTLSPRLSARFRERLNQTVLLILITLFTLTQNSAAELHTEQAALRDLQKRISVIQKKIRTDAKARDKNIGSLESYDKSIAKKQNVLAQSSKELVNAQSAIDEIEIRKQSALANLTIEQKQLAALIQLAHKQQGSSTLKWLLDLQDPSELARTMTYYRYMMQSQKENLQTVSKDVLQFVDLLTEAQTAKNKTLDLKNKRAQEILKLQNAREEREALIQQLNQRISSQESQVKKLEQEEAALQSVIAEIEKALANFPKDNQQAFKLLKGKLAWPLKGRIQNVYGNYRIPKQGLRWRGLQIKADRHSEIRAIAYGRIVYADWLPGLGLLTILDHGDGYLSLYGNCEMLFKEVGTWVNPGEVIALVGDSGGRNEVGLYLELRKGKRPFSPQSWFRTRKP